MAEQFRKKPVTIEAMRFVGAESAQQIFDWLDDHETGASYFPERLEEDGGEVVVSDAEHMNIWTLEGTMRASVGDWIIRGVQGEFYPCKPEIFEATYEPVWPMVTDITLTSAEPPREISTRIVADLTPYAEAMAQATHESAGKAVLSTADELAALPSGAVVIGPEFHSEVYGKHGDLFFTMGSEDPWPVTSLVARGPFRVLFIPGGARD